MPLNEAYSPLKILNHLDQLDAIKHDQPTAPIHVQLIISDLCNQSCSFCAYRSEGYTTNELFDENRMIEYGKCVEILEDCCRLGTRAIQFTGGGEPTVHPNHKLIFQECLDRDLDLALVTNGVRLGRSLSEILLPASWVRVSIDAGLAATYARVRKSSKDAFHRVWKNIGNFAAAQHRQALLGIGFVATKENWREVLTCATRAKDAGADNFRISAIFQAEGASYFDGWYEEASDLCYQTKELLSDKRFTVFNNFNSRVGDLHQLRPDYSMCGLQRVQTYIGADLSLYRCCVTAYSKKGLLGSLKDKSFYDLWKTLDFSSHDARVCPRCMYNDKNKVILYAIKDNPLHGNFV